MWGISQALPPLRLRVFTVASSSSNAATMSPLSASDCCRTTTQSPSQMAASIMESPRTSSMKNVPFPTSCLGREKTSSTCSWARMGPPAAILPSRGVSTASGREVWVCSGSGSSGAGASGETVSGRVTTMARGRFGLRRMKPAFSSTFSW